jgi:cellulose synthase/poly-beta-1,6-N-acetylglucosamine synthase-like glycosyltransferase/peptidoglycan/xylan/chitin deacetylase (PgdA/CDA1 family)
VRSASPVRRRWAPSGHWLLLTVVAVATALALLLQGFDRHEVGRSATAVAPDTTASAIGTGSVYFRADGTLQSRGLPAKTVALTFDDGPDPRWTPQILGVLAREQVPATFFDVGARIHADPGLVRREYAAGHEIGVHTFTHVALSGVPGWRQNLELSLSQLSLSGAFGRTSALLRPPYSSTPDALTAADLGVIRRVTGRGYLVALADLDSEDWRRPGWISIVANSLPAGDAGAVVLMHDGGGDRAQTVEALPHLIDTLKARGYRFTTVTGGLGLAGRAADQKTSAIARWQGVAFLWVLTLSIWFAQLVTWLLIPLGLLALARTLVLMGFARHHARRAWRRVGSAEHLPPVSVIVPAYNEAVGIEAAVRSLAASDYPRLQVIVVDDGSTDGTAELVESLRLRRVRVIRQPNQGKAVALNTGIAAASYNVLVMVDGDTVFQPDTVRALVQPLQDPRVGAVSGNTKVGNRRKLLGRWQHLEYVIGFNLDRRMYDLVGCMPTVPGAIGAFRRSVLVAVGGVSVDTLAEDTDLTMAVNRAGFWVVYEERAIAWTEAPSTLAALWRQRYRWCYGTLQAIWKHRGAIHDEGHGRRLGRVGLPYLLAFQVVLPLLAPVIDIFALYGLVFLDPWRVAAYWLMFAGLQLVAAAYALRLDRESLRPLWTLPLQQFVYRQLMYLVVIQSLVTAASGAHLGWHKLERTGDAAESMPVPVGL